MNGQYLKSSWFFIAAFSLICMPVAFGQSFLTNGLVAYYPFNANAHDGSGNGYDGTVSSNCWFIADRFGYANHAIFITNDTEESVSDAGRIDLPPAAINALSSGTISAWINPQVASSGAILTKQHNGVDGTMFTFGGSTDGYGQWFDGDPGVLYFHPQNGAPAALSSSSLTAGMWQQVVVVFTGGSCSFYINGVLCGTNAGDYGVPDDLDPSVNTSIGCWMGDGFSYVQPRLLGAIDDVRVYNRAFSDEEVQQLYQIETNSTAGNPGISLGKAVFVKFSNLNIGYSYQLQTSTNLTDWTDGGPPFTATTTNMTSRYWNVDDWNQLFFRLQ